MRLLLPLARADARFQLRSGFYALYALLALLYLLLLSLVPPNLRETTCVLLVFTDPAVMGLFFMGAILLLERSQRVLPALAVSPAGPWAYAGAKAVSLSLVSLAAGAALCLYGTPGRLPVRLASVFLGACFFSLAGLVAAFHSGSLNQFILLSVLAECLLCVPGVLVLLGLLPRWLYWHPGALLVLGLRGSAPAALLLLPWLAAALALAAHTAKKYFYDRGGIKL